MGSLVIRDVSNDVREGSEKLEGVAEVVRASSRTDIERAGAEDVEDVGQGGYHVDTRERAAAAKGRAPMRAPTLTVS